MSLQQQTYSQNSVNPRSWFAEYSVSAVTKELISDMVDTSDFLCGSLKIKDTSELVPYWYVLFNRYMKEKGYDHNDSISRLDLHELLVKFVNNTLTPIPVDQVKQWGITHLAYWAIQRPRINKYLCVKNYSSIPVQKAFLALSELKVVANDALGFGVSPTVIDQCITRWCS